MVFAPIFVPNFNNINILGLPSSCVFVVFVFVDGMGPLFV